MPLVLGLTACGLAGYEGQGDYPSAGPVPPVGSEWRSDDGTAGVRLGPAGTAYVWGIPWYVGSAGCESEDLQFVTAAVYYQVWEEPHNPGIDLEYDTGSGLSPASSVDSRFLARASSTPGWQTLHHSPCHLFNDGNDLELHLVD